MVKLLRRNVKGDEMGWAGLYILIQGILIGTLYVKGFRALWVPVVLVHVVIVGTFYLFDGK